MRNKRLLIVVLALSIMLMGAGYAAWTQSFEVAATVDTGNLEVNCIRAETSVYTLFPEGSARISEYAKSKADISDDLKEVTVEIDDLYPGTFFTLDMNCRNDGTIAVVCDGVEVDFDENTVDVLKQEIKMRQIYYDIYRSDGTSDLDFMRDFDVDNLPNLAELEARLTKLLKGKRLEPGESLLTGDRHGLGIGFRFPIESTNESESSHLGMTIKIKWKQFNQ